MIEANGEKKYHRVYPKFVAECSLACENNVTHLQQQIAECREKISELEKVGNKGSYSQDSNFVHTAMRSFFY